jgi:hypothetical protein
MKRFGAGDFDTLVSVQYRDDTPNAFMERTGYVEHCQDYAKVEWLETIKDNQTETAKSHDSSFAIARLVFRDEPVYVVHKSTNRYVFDGQLYETVGVPQLKKREGVVYVNVKTRDDI